ncbi:hypothetical protein KAJ41_01100 [Candidatus Parcubacteria bacterium]|nr:hypothetical protein [Candidatus Parcubacteria bacterium]
MSLSDKSIKEFQEIFKKEYGKEISYDEAAESGERLVGFFKLLYDCEVRDIKRKEKLKEFPKGYSLMDGNSYNCGICHSHIKDEQLWYDKWGIKCLACQNAVNRKMVPGKICYNDKLWYAMWEFESYFKLKSPTVRKLERQGILKSRTIPDTGFKVFIIKDNIGTLPPKNLVKSRTVRVGKNTYSSQDWYEFQDPKTTLKNYKIWDYLTAFKK